MNTHLRVLGVVTARGGSKGVPRKNIRLLCGKPLLQYTAESALAAKRLNRVILSTDDEEIAEVGRRCGFVPPGRLWNRLLFALSSAEGIPQHIFGTSIMAVFQRTE
jgi:hypothetical protein